MNQTAYFISNFIIGVTNPTQKYLEISNLLRHDVMQDTRLTELTNYFIHLRHPLIVFVHSRVELLNVIQLFFQFSLEFTTYNDIKLYDHSQSIHRVHAALLTRYSRDYLHGTQSLSKIAYGFQRRFVIHMCGIECLVANILLVVLSSNMTVHQTTRLLQEMTKIFVKCRPQQKSVTNHV